MVISKKSLLFLFVMLVAGVAALAVYLFTGKNQVLIEKSPGVSAADSQIFSQDALKKEDTKISLLAVGDIMLDRGVEAKIKKYGNGDFSFPFLKIADILKSADITFANLESQVSDLGYSVGSACCSFRADPKAIDGLRFAGFDILTVANNHALDWTGKAFLDSLKRLTDAGIVYTGGGVNEADAFGPKFIELKGTKIGFLSYTNFSVRAWRAGPDSAGMALIEESDIEKVVEDIKNAKKQCDILIVSCHAGTEYTTKLEKFQKLFYEVAIDNGADLVIGHHPHVIQPLLRYKDGWIAYSLGNFIFDQDFSEETMKGMLLNVKIEDKKIQEVEPRTIKMNKDYQPELQ